MAMKPLIGTLIGVAALTGSVALAQAGDQPEPSTINATLLITNVMRQPVDHQQRQLAYDESLRRAGPTPANRGAFNGEVQPDGSVRYGDVTVSAIKNPCPPGEHVELPSPPPLARRARR
jgi:hypothetical protein